MKKPLLVDAHEDLAWNMLVYGRDYTRSVAETRASERGNWVVQENGDTLLGWPEYQQGRVALVFGTLFAPPRARYNGTKKEYAYASAEEAHQLYWRQLEIYHQLTETHPDKFRLVTSPSHLQAVLDAWTQTTGPAPVGIVPLMEGADGIRTPDEVQRWWEGGVRIIGLAWAGTRYSGGTRAPGPLTSDGRELLKQMAAFPFILDLSHMDPLAARQALDSYEGPIIASHANPAAMLPGVDNNRHLPDDVIRQLAARGGVIGVVAFNLFLQAGWQRGDARDGVTLETLADHIDYICQLTGSARHVGLGSDFDGGFGLQAAPAEIHSVADLQKLAEVLARRGYREEDIAAILGQNWIRFLQQALPEVA